MGLKANKQVGDEIQKAFPDCNLYFASERDWGSQHPNHRELMKQELKAMLEESPQAPFSSIAHAPGMGVILIATYPVGVDVELSERVSTEIVARVSRPEERAQAPNAAALWCAKEACFKALQHFSQPSVIGALDLVFFKAQDREDCCFFELKNARDFKAPPGKGFVLNKAPHSYAVFMFKPGIG